MKFLAAALSALFVAVSVPVSAQDNPVVVELFTSQGCSSCPPADALLKRISQRDDVIALALHVDYWDYIGWKDEYGSADHTRRQKAYAHVGNRRMIYTPQMIVNGHDSLVGAKSMELADLVMTYKEQPDVARVTAVKQDQLLDVKIWPVSAPLDGEFDVHLVRYQPKRTAHITRGENAGRDLEYHNIVSEWVVLGQWDGAGPIQLSAKVEGKMPAVVLVQKAGHGAMVAAARAE